MTTETLVAKFQALPPPAQRQVEAFIDALSGASAKSKPGRRKLFKSLDTGRSAWPLTAADEARIQNEIRKYRAEQRRRKA